MALVQAIVGLMIATIIGVVVAVPVTKDAIDNQSFTGTLKTVTDVIPLMHRCDVNGRCSSRRCCGPSCSKKYS